MREKNKIKEGGGEIEIGQRVWRRKTRKKDKEKKEMKRMDEMK